MSPEDEMLISEVAQELNVSHVTVWRHVQSKALPARRVGPIYLVKRKDLDVFKANRKPIGRPRKQPPAVPFGYPMAGDVATFKRVAEH